MYRNANNEIVDSDGYARSVVIMRWTPPLSQLIARLHTIQSENEWRRARGKVHSRVELCVDP